MRSKTQFSGLGVMPYPLKTLVATTTRSASTFPSTWIKHHTWLESLDKNSIDEWDQLKAQFTSNFAGAMGCSGTRMDLAMVKQEQGETLCQYMRRFFNKRAMIIDVTDKEVIDLFQDGLYHRRTFEDFGRHRPSSITKLMDMISSWVDKEDKANAKYDSIRGKSKHNTGGNGNNTNNNTRTMEVTTTFTRVLITSASQTTQSRLSNALRIQLEEDLWRFQRPAEREVPVASGGQPHH
jgi:hypothetical protein